MLSLSNDWPLLAPLALTMAGLISGFINTLAGGGSLLTIPMLMLFGLPAERANATNRVCVLGQALASSVDFRRAGKLDSPDLLGILAMASAGGLVGAVAATAIAPELFRWVMLALLGAMALLLTAKPSLFTPVDARPVRRLWAQPTAALGLFGAGFYGGFLQAGVGFLLLWAIVGGLGYDLVRGNAIKMLTTLAFTAISLAIFVADDLVDWLPGLYLTVGTVVGAKLGVKLSLRIDENILRRIVLVMVLLTLAAAALKS